MKKNMRNKIIVIGLLLVLAGTSVLPSISGNSKEGNEITSSTPRYREGGTPYDPSQSLYPYAIRCPKPRDAPTSGYIESPPEYTPVRGVLFTYKSSDWATVVRDLVVALTRPTQNDEIAYVVVSSTVQMNSAISLFTAGGANMSKVQFIIEPINAIWMRDYGPHFIWQDGALGIVDSNYYPTRPLDNFIPTLLGDDIFKIPTYDIGLYYSGGNFQPGPNRTGFTTSLINTDNPSSEGFNATYIAELFQTYQGIDTFHVMPQLPPSVDGTGHIDMWMYLVDDHTVIISKFKPGSNPQAITITENAVPYMQNLGFTVYRTPAWNANHPSYGMTHWTYTNAYRVNNRIFIPTYGQGNPAYLPDDAEALANWTAAAGPGVEIVPINCYPIIYAAGAMHCIVMQIPRYTNPTPAVHLISPNGGELLASGTTHQITWVATDTDNQAIPQIELYYSTDAGTNYNYIATTTNNGVYNWSVPYVTTDQAKIKIVAISSDTDYTETESTTVFEISPASQTIYDFSTGAGVNKFGYGHQTLSWAQINNIRTPVTTPIDTLVSGAYVKIAYSDATGGDSDSNRYISPNPQSAYESTHVYEFTINENPSGIDDLAIHWEGYAKSCTQIELYLWDYTAGQWCDTTGRYGQNRFIDNWAGTRDGYLDLHLRSNISQYINPNGQLTLLLYTHRATYASYHDYIAITVTIKGEVSPSQSFVTLTNENTPHLFSCPADDGPTYQHAKVTVKNAGGQPIPGIPSNDFQFTLGGTGAIWYGTLSCTFTAVDTQTNANGEIRFTVKGDTSIYGNITIQAIVQGIPLNDIDTLACKSPDYFCDGAVILGDFVIFGQDYGRIRWRSDFTGDGGPNGLGDFVMFGQHYAHHV